MVALTVQGVEKRFADGPPVLDKLDLQVADGEFFTLLGPSGCGKTTLLRCIAGFLQPDAGAIAMDDRRIDPCRRTGATSAWCSRTTRSSRT